MDFSSLQNCRYAVIGDPVAHSRSPEMQNAGFAALGLGTPYGKIQVRPDELAEFAAYARKYLDGFNITVPHKERIIPLLDEIAPHAGLAGSVNTVSVAGGRLIGTSTDGYGLEGALREAFGFGLAGGAVLFAGTGGAAQAAAFYFAAQNVRALYFANRTADRAEALAARIRAAFPGVRCEAAPLDGIGALIAESDVIIQSSSVGLKDPAEALFDLDLLKRKPGIFCFETIYHRTAFLEKARELGLKNADGRGMLLHQGARSLEIWTGKQAPVEAMRSALQRSMER